jgi:hypothetical protein
MKKIITFIGCMLLMMATGFGQTTTEPDCGTPERDTLELETLPWFDNNQYLENFLDSIGYNNMSGGGNTRIIGPNQVRLRIPVKFWVYRRADGSGGPNLANIRDYMDNLNRAFNVDNQTLMGFYIRCEVTFIDNNSHFDIESVDEARDLIRDNSNAGCINVHIANSIPRGSLGTYYAPGLSRGPGIMLSRATYDDNRFASTFPHEVGHYFGLDHTHQYHDKGRCRREAIDRNRRWPTFNFCFSRVISGRIAEATGDLLSDTPADPEIGNNLTCVFNLLGEYTGSTDLWGDSYANPPAGSQVPNARNLMSYNRDRTCRTQFTRQQIAVMLAAVFRFRDLVNLPFWLSNDGEYDSFEMDDFPEIARPIVYHELQERNFHRQYLGSGLWTQCDADWVRFVPACSGQLTVETGAMTGRNPANTRLTLFNATLTQLAQNDNISASNLFSSLTFNFVAGQTYLIRIDNMSPGANSYYTLQIGRMTLTSIGTGPICGSRQFSVTGLPAGITPAWTLNPSSGGWGVSSTGLVSYSGSGSGTATLTATVVACGQTVQLTQTLQFGSPVPTNLRVIGHCASGPNCGRAGQVIISCSAVSGATQYRWYINGVLAGTTTIPQYSVRRAFACDEYVEFSVEANGPCGWSLPASSAFVYTASCNGGFRVSTTPNPAQSVLTVTIDSEKGQPLPAAKGSTELILYDAATKQPVKNWRFGAGQTQFRLDVSTLRKGSYTLEVMTGTERKAVTVIIN